MPNLTTNEMIIQPNPYAGGIPRRPITMPNAKTNLPGQGGASSNGGRGQGQNSMTMEDDVSMFGPGTQLQGTPQRTDPIPGRDARPVKPGVDLIGAVNGSEPKKNYPAGSGPASETGKATGWSRSGADWYYFDPDTSKMAKGWKMIDNKWYYFSEAGVMQVGWQLVTNQYGSLWYYLEPSDGHMLIDWQYINGEWYYLETTDGNGQMVTGWKKHDGKWHFLLDTGAMAHGGWQLIDEKWYCFGDNGEMEASKILDFEGKKYYVGTDGAMVTSADVKQVTYGRMTYEVDEKGVCTAIRNNLEDKIEVWMSSVESMGNWYAQNVHTYQKAANSKSGTGKRGHYYCNLINMEVGDDCSAYVSVCLILAGIANYSEYGSTNFNKLKDDYSSGLGKRLGQYGFSWHIFDSDYLPERGDISVQHQSYIEDGKSKTCHHVEVVDSYDASTGVCWIWSWGDVYPHLPTSRNNWKKRTSGYWRIEQ